MRANLSDELLNSINDKIYIDLVIHSLNTKLYKAEQEGNKEFADSLNDVILTVIRERRNINQHLRDNGIKVYEPEYFFDVKDDEPIFIDYKYAQKINGGYKEGVNRYWKAALKVELKKRVNKYFERRH